jgi:SAM-dependent methyltransferase
VSAPPPDHLPATLAAMFPRRWDRSYVASKLRTDPLYGGVFPCLEGSELPLLDLGCGLGLLAFYLRKRGFHPPIVALDYDQRKIAQACRVAATHHVPGLSFHHHDARLGLPAHSGNVTILDLLQFFGPDDLRILLREAAHRVAPGGALVIRSGLRDRSLRFRLTVAGDLLARATRWMKSAPVHYPAREDFEEILAPFGALSISPLWGRTPFNNYLLVLRRSS